MPYSESASTTAFITAGKDPAHPASPHPFAPSGLVFAGTGWLSTWNIIRVGGARQCIIREGSGQELALFIEHGLLHQRLTDALNDPAMHLSRHQQRVHDNAEIIDHRIFDDFNDTGLRVDLDLGDVAAIRKGRGRAFMDMLYIE
jgi:hypothetical protein